MKVSKSWLRELVDLKISDEELEELIPLRIIGLKDVTPDFFELDMKGYNRADLLSLRGVAREIGAVSDSLVKFSEISEGEFEWSDKDLPKTPVSIEDSSLAEAQVVAKIENLTSQKSPEKWVKKLEDSGLRSIDPITDITNLIMIEYGQPLHSFDESWVLDETINVRSAKDGEEITTIDHKKRLLTSDDIVLADTEKPLDVAGVMGGVETEIKDSTTTILLSASIFNPKKIRKTSQRLGLYSEASKRFQHGLTKTNLLQAINAAIKMYQELGGKLTAINLVGEFDDKEKTINLTSERVKKIIGVEIANQKIEEYLKTLGFTVSGNGPWEVTLPYWRLDLNIEDDLIEDIARMYGYENIPSIELSGELPSEIDQSLFKLIEDIKDSLYQIGLTEIQTYSYHTTLVLDFLSGFGEKDNYLVKVKNPMSKETEYMRGSVWSNLIEVIGKNMRAGYEDIAIFEIGKVYNKENGDIKERYVLSLGLMNSSSNPISELNQIFKSLLDKLKLNISAESGEVPAVVKNVFHPKRFLNISKDSELIGGMSEVHLRVLDKLGIQKRVAILEINLEDLI